MCGISGALSTRRDFDLNTVVDDIIHDQLCRGPDAQAARHFTGHGFELVLGHNRLSVIDLSAEANQPMSRSDDNGDLHVVFNGEIYNYLELRAELERAGQVFMTRSDTEVILAAYRAWGDAAFDRFIGMFALALYDPAAKELLLVRDRFGVKPLYYWTDGETVVFASTPTVIARHAGLAPNLDYVARGIRFKYFEDETDIAPYAGLHAVEPSHLVRIHRRGDELALEKIRYYDVRQRAELLAPVLAGESDAGLEDRLLSLLRSAVTLRRRSDVPLGISISGGLDSSAIAVLASEGLERVIGYSYGRPDRPETEGPLVAMLSRHCPLETRWVWLEGRDALTDLFWRTLAAQDAPFPHASIMAQHAVFQAARADGTVVLLGGQGGDEAFMGYRKFFLFYAQSVARERRVRQVPHLVSTLLPLVPPVAKRAGLFFAERKRYQRTGSGMGSSLVLPSIEADTGMGMSAGQSTRERQVLDVTRYSLPTLLRYEDRNSMGNSIESRLPFLDHRVMEFGLALPERVKLGNGFGKLILRRVMRDRIPDAIRLNRDKRGFDVNQQGWIEQGLGAVLRDALEARRAVVGAFFPRGQSVSSLFSDQRFAADPQAFKEAVSLIWLGDRL